MSDAIGIPSVEIAPKRRSRLAISLSGWPGEKPLGTISGIIILILILVAILAMFWLLIHIRKCTW